MPARAWLGRPASAEWRKRRRRQRRKPPPPERQQNPLREAGLPPKPRRSRCCAAVPDPPGAQKRLMMSADFRPKSDFLSIMMERGYVHQCSDFAGVDEKARNGELTAYIGYDCTAPSLHIGH